MSLTKRAFWDEICAEFPDDTAGAAHHEFCAAWDSVGVPAAVRIPDDEPAPWDGPSEAKLDDLCARDTAARLWEVGE